MTAALNSPEPREIARKVIYRNAGDAIYGLGLIGALIYYIQHAATFVVGVLGVLKAIAWPALLVYGLLEFFKL